MNKILVIRFPYIFQDLEYTLNLCGMDCDVLELDNNSDILGQIKEKDTEGYDTFISYIFKEAISDYCEQNGILYICYIYDSPLNMLFSKALFNSCNRIFIFDKREYLRLKEIKSEDIYYLPLGANVDRMGLVEVTEEDEVKYSRDIAFVGNLYDDDNLFDNVIGQFPVSMKERIEKYLHQNVCGWEKVREWPRLDNDIVDFLKKALGWENPYHEYFDDGIFFGVNFLSRKLAELDRKAVLNTIAKAHPVELYTYSHPRDLVPGVNVRESIDYNREMVKVMYLSRINLNITLPSIETGLPQRMFDIMGAGGFLLTNYQEEIEEYYEIGKDLEVFKNLEELEEKVNYYLSHERERLVIAMNGYRKTRESHNFQTRIRSIIGTCL